MKLTSKITTLMLLLALLFSPSTMVIGQDEEKPDEPVTEVEKPEEKPEEKSKTQLDPNVYIGHGYDIMGKYADSDSRRAAIFDLTENEVKPIANPRSRYQEFSGKSLAEYQTNFSNKLSIGGSYKIFSASVSVNFASDDSSSSAKEYMTIMNTVARRRYQMPINEKSKVSTGAQEAIDTMDIQQLFTDYGTHYIWQADVGGRVDYNLTFNRTTSQKDLNVQVAAKAAIQAVIGSVSIENETSFKNSIKKMEEAGKVNIEVYGGAPDASAKVRQSTAALAEWANTVEASPTLAGFTERSLKPIWNLASTPERAQEIKQAFDEYARSKEIKEAPGMIAIRKATGTDQVASNWYGAGTDGAGNVHHQFAAWTPKADTANGYYVVGHAANRSSETNKAGSIKTILVQEIGEPGKLLAPPLDFTMVTEYTGGRGARQWSIWRANCPVNFVALGDFAKWDKDKPNMDIPQQNPFKDVRCVNVGQVEAAAPLSKEEVIHDNDGSGEWKFITYRIKPVAGSDAINGNFFYGVRVEDFNAPPPEDVDVYVLKNQAVAGLSVITRESNEDVARVFPTVRGGRLSLFR